VFRRGSDGYSLDVFVRIDAKLSRRERAMVDRWISSVSRSDVAAVLIDRWTVLVQSTVGSEALAARGKRRVIDALDEALTMMHTLQWTPPS
jgi:hypothetical protein